MPKTFLDMSYSDIISQIVGSYGLSATVSGPAMSRRHPYVLKTGTNFEFFDDIALRTGSAWYVDVKGKLQFVERASGAAAATLKFGEDLIRRETVSKPRHDEAPARDWKERKGDEIQHRHRQSSGA